MKTRHALKSEDTQTAKKLQETDCVCIPVHKIRSLAVCVTLASLQAAVAFAPTFLAPTKVFHRLHTSPSGAV